MFAEGVAIAHESPTPNYDTPRRRVTAGLDREQPDREQIARSVEQRTGRGIRHLAVRGQDNQVVLTGDSDSFYLKQLATLAVQSACPAAELRNDIRVHGR